MRPYRIDKSTTAKDIKEEYFHAVSLPKTRSRNDRGMEGFFPLPLLKLLDLT
jgi:hypothetical protein